MKNNHKIKIGIMGGAGEHGDQLFEDGLKIAYQIGQEIARSGATLVTGATTGLPYAAVLGASDFGGKTLGISPGKNAIEHVRFIQKPLDGLYEAEFTGRGLIGREIENVAHCTAVIAIGGGTGTMTELGIASQAAMPIGGYTNAGGTGARVKTDPEFFGRYGSIISFSNDPDELVQDAIRNSISYLENPQGLAKKGYLFLFGKTRDDLANSVVRIDSSLDAIVKEGLPLAAKERSILAKIRGAKK
jgi:uncharacterized protein (TIGR00725 family)